MLIVKTADVGRIAGDQGRRDELREFHDGQLFRVVTQGPGFVEHPGALPLGLLEQMGGVKILAVKRRVLAHQDRVKVLDRLRALVRPVLLGLKPVFLLAGQANVAHIGGHALATLPGDVLGFTHTQAVTALLRLTHHGKSAVLVDAERLQGVGNNQQVHERFQISIFEPNSTTELLGSLRKSAAALALRCIWANNFSRQGDMPPPMVGITVSRDRK